VGDPGVPVMIGLLAVPVGVLLLVVMLALIGGRWTVPGSYAAEPEPPEPLEDYEEPYVDPWRADPWRLAEPPRPALPPAPRPPAHRPHALPPVSRLALPAASQPPPQRPSQDLVPAPRPYRPPAGPPPARPAYGSLAREQRDPYGHPAEPEQERQSPPQQGFPYGPYRHQ
jgi:hypothetical protein